MGAAAEDSFRILVATDNHLGYGEKDPIRGNDSFETFEEILELAVDENVDMILLGGDLFHENKPTRHCMNKCMELLRKYTFGDKPVQFDFVSDPVENFKHSKNPVVNYQDPNLNVAIPVFSIHGNHDDPSGLGQFCALDTLSAAGLINYFGRTTDLKEVVISPILLEKGRTKLALFGLSSIRDERLFRLFKENKVKMLRPKESMDDWFNIMVLHQNHAKHGMTSYIPEEFLDPFLDLVIWGHEHECLIDPKASAEGSFHVMQPGSSVVTSLCAGEAVEKHVAILEVTHDKRFKIDKHKLRTVRPFLFEDLNLADHEMDIVVSNDGTEIENFVEEHIRNMLLQVKNKLTGHSRQPKKPLIRLRIEYTNESQMFNTVRFGHRFEEDVANPSDMILFKKQRVEPKKAEIGIDNDAMDALFQNDVSETRVENLVESYFAEIENDYHQLFLLTEKGLAHAVNSFVEKDDKDALSDLINHQITKTREHLMKMDLETEENCVEEAIRDFRRQRLDRKNVKNEEEEAEAFLNNPGRQRTRRSASDDDEDADMNSDDDMDVSSSKPTSGRGSRGGRGRGSRGGRAASRASASGARGGRGSSASSSSKAQLTLLGDGSPIGARGTGRGSRGRGQTKYGQTSIMDSFARSSQRNPSGGIKKGVIYDISDSD